MNDRERSGLRGQVRAFVLETDYVYPDHHWVMKTSTIFSPEGNLLRQDHQNPDGSSWSVACVYDERGLILGRRGSEAPHGKEWALSYSYDYDAFGRLERVLRRPPAGESRVLESYRYEANGRKILTEYPLPALRARSTSADRGVSFSLVAGHLPPEASSVVTFFDEHDRPVKRVIYDANDRVDRRILFRYDAAGRLVEQGEDEGNGRIRQDSRQVWTYDNQGRILSETAHHYAFGTCRMTFLYNENGDVAEERYQNTLGILADIHGDGCCQERYQNTPGILADVHGGGCQDWTKRFRYLYDENGNWTERATETVQSTGEKRLSMVERRSLEYYQPAFRVSQSTM